MGSTKLLGGALFATVLVSLICPPPFVVAGGVCHSVECGKGNCTPSIHSTVGFVCKCDAGWIQSALTGETDGNDFLPCVFPNCSLDLLCNSSLSPFPAPVEAPPADDRPVLNPCRWVNCERGSCKMKSAFNWTCECPRGFFNVAGNPAFPCFAPCVIGSDCSKLGATLSNHTSSSAFMSPSISPTPQPPTGGALRKKEMKVELGFTVAMTIAVMLTA